MPILSTLILLALATLVAGFTAQRISYSSSTLLNGDPTIPPASFVAPIVRKMPRSKAKKFLQQSLRNPSGPYFSSRIAGVRGDAVYVVNITIGRQDFAVILDTGRLV